MFFVVVVVLFLLLFLNGSNNDYIFVEYYTLTRYVCSSRYDTNKPYPAKLMCIALTILWECLLTAST